MAAEHSEFLTEVLTVLVPLGDVRSRRMFGGHGLFLEDRMFALVSRDSGLFLKADDINRGAFAARGCKTHGKMPYFFRAARGSEQLARHGALGNGSGRRCPACEEAEAAKACSETLDYSAALPNARSASLSLSLNSSDKRWPAWARGERKRASRL